MNFPRDSNPKWSPLQLTEVSIGKEMICQMLFNNNIVHESLKVIQMNNTDCQEPLVVEVIVLRRQFSKSLFFLKQKNMNILKNNVHSSCV